MPIRTGNIASGDDFFDREIELEDIWNYIEGNHLALNGPRRLGKSSILVRVAEQATEKGMLAQRIDVAGATSADEFIAEFEAAYPETWVKRQMESLGSNLKSFANRFRKVDIKVPGLGGGVVELDALPETHWKKTANKLQARLTYLPALIMVDEFSVFLEKLINRDQSEAEQLLAWLRKWRQEQTECRFIFSGSIGLNSLLERHNLTTWMNDCHDFKLGPFRSRAAIHMLKKLADREKWQLESETAEYIC